MLLKDLECFARSAVSHLVGKLQSPSKDFFYWNGHPRPELDELIVHLSNPYQPERIVIRKILREKKVNTLLDAACGPAVELDGYLLEQLPLQYTGFDRSKYMIQYAQQKHPKYHFQRGDVHHLPFSDNEFEAVLLKHILEHLPDYKQPIQEALRVAESYVIIDFFHSLTPLPTDCHFWDYHGFYTNWYSKQRFEDFLQTQPIKGFTVHNTKGNAQQTAQIYVVEKK